MSDNIVLLYVSFILISQSGEHYSAHVFFLFGAQFLSGNPCYDRSAVTFACRKKRLRDGPSDETAKTDVFYYDRFGRKKISFYLRP